MIRIVHISDPHFGAEEPRLVEGLLAAMHELRPGVIVVSGDLTQRATGAQYRSARAFLDALPAAAVVAVPGNHDVPAWNLAVRFCAPLSRYRRHIARDAEPVHEEDGLMVAGVNTARSWGWYWNWARGRISIRQVRRAAHRFMEAPEGALRVLVAHHPFIPPEDEPGTRLVGRCGRALRLLEAARADVILSGHLHRAFARAATTHHGFLGRSMLLVQAATATSRRVRGEPNAFNVLEWDGERLGVEVRAWGGEGFVGAGRAAYRRGAEGLEAGLEEGAASRA